jgi:hypothetical protein
MLLWSMGDQIIGSEMLAQARDVTILHYAIVKSGIVKVHDSFSL